jgi:hypothetical protein
VNREPKDEFWGERTCNLTDPYDHDWTVRLHDWAQHRDAFAGPTSVLPVCTGKCKARPVRMHALRQYGHRAAEGSAVASSSVSRPDPCMAACQQTGQAVLSVAGVDAHENPEQGGDG